MSLSKRQIFQIYQLKDIGYSERRIAKEMGVSRQAVRKYLIEPNPVVKNRIYHSQLEPYYPIIERYLERDNLASAVVISQRLIAQGYKGGLTIVRDYLRQIRGKSKEEKAYIRYESSPGEQCQIDWGYFGVLKYGKDYRKVWCFAMEESFSRLLYLEFTHSCNLDVFIGAHIRAFSFFGGTPRELLHDNLKTAVIERDGRLVRFNEHYLDFLRSLHITPHACNPHSPHEKGKVEKGGIHYIRYNFWPLRTITDIHDLNNQAEKWRDEIANIRIHNTTREKPVDRFKRVDMRAVLKDSMDPRETKSQGVYRDCRIWFDCNYYTVPYWAVGKSVLVKADNNTLTIYYKDHIIARHQRCWEKHMVIDNPNHIKKLLERKKGALASKQQEYFLSLDPVAQVYLNALQNANLPVKKNIQSLLRLKDIYGIPSLVSACKIALKHNALGADYVENILLQQMLPKQNYPPVIMKQDDYNNLLITEADLVFYDNLIFRDTQKEDKKDEQYT